MTVTNEISKAFNKQALEYEAAAIIQQEIGERLLERLQYIKIKPQRILDLGCGTGVFSQKLSVLFPQAQVISLDLAHEMLLQAKKKQGWLQKWPLVNANMEQLPFAEGGFDLVFANQVIHWGSSMATVFRELSRVMNANACLMFTTLGPDTFKELKQAWFGIDAFSHVNEFADMHDIGDCLMAERFLDPVMDMETLAVHYETVAKLLNALQSQGVKNIHTSRNKGLTGKGRWNQFLQNFQTLQTDKGKFPLSYEVLYGHAWKGEQRKTEQGIETRIPISSIVTLK